MNNLLFVVLLVFASTNGFSQTAPNETTLFAQCMIDIDNESEIKALEIEIKKNPYVQIVRVDFYSKRVFLLTKGIEQLTEQNLISWFSQYSDKVRCVQIGVHGVDIVKPFPFEGCEN
jgi:hypothetical protein